MTAIFIVIVLNYFFINRSADDAIREVKAMEDLNSPHIVRYFDAFTDTPCDLDCAVGQSTSSNPNKYVHIYILIVVIVIIFLEYQRH